MASKFIQLVEVNTEHLDEIKELYFQWAGNLAEETPITPIITVDIESDGWYMIIVIYDSRADAIKVSEMDVTKYIYKKIAEFSAESPYFRNLQVLE